MPRKYAKNHSMPVNLTDAENEVLNEVHAHYPDLTKHACLKAALRWAFAQELLEPGLLANYFHRPVDLPEDPKERANAIARRRRGVLTDEELAELESED